MTKALRLAMIGTLIGLLTSASALAAPPATEQVTSQINQAGPAAPERFPFPISGDVAALRDGGDGSIEARDSAGSLISTLAPAWARDANGTAVPTAADAGARRGPDPPP